MNESDYRRIQDLQKQRQECYAQKQDHYNEIQSLKSDRRYWQEELRDVRKAARKIKQRLAGEDTIPRQLDGIESNIRSHYDSMSRLNDEIAELNSQINQIREKNKSRQ